MSDQPIDIENQISSLTAAVSQLSESVSQLSLVATRNQSDISSLTDALGIVVTEFVRPAAKQALENYQTIEKMSAAITSLAKAEQRHQEWLDEDRRDINRLRQETSGQIQALIEQANADRVSADRRFDGFATRFDAMQAEIRQNRWLILAQGDRLDKQGERLDAAISENKTLLDEVLSLSHRVTAVEDAA